MKVTVGFVQGEKVTGVLGVFSPQNPELTIEVEQAEGGESCILSMQVETKDVVFLGFHKQGEEASEIQPPEGARPVKLYTTGNQLFWIKTHLSLLKHPIGFYAFPLEASKSLFSHIYFFSHSVRQREKAEHIGDLLRKDNQITTQELQKGLLVQEELRQTRIGEVLVEHDVVSSLSLEEAVELQKHRRMRLGELLLQASLISEEELARALDEQKERKEKRLGEILIDLGILKEETLYLTLAEKFYLPYVDLKGYPIEFEAAQEVDLKWLKAYQFLPLSSTHQVMTIAISDPLNWNLVDLLRFHLGKEIREVIVRPSQLQKFIEDTLFLIEQEKEKKGNKEDAKDLATQEVYVILEEIKTKKEEEKGKSERDEVEEAKGLGMVTISSNDPPITKLANQIIVDAFESNASDIHIEPYGEADLCRIRFRIDGKCFLYKEVPSNLWRNLVTRYKVMAQLDIAERRLPQDGKIRLQLEERILELRVATLPTTNKNEDVVMRLLAASKPLSLEELGLAPRNSREVKRIIEMPHGLILCVGPTGSGKTTTLHSLLGHINRVDKKIWTAEDPVEITQKGLRQVQVNANIGMTFAKAMRAFLRADPDVIMVGEMRDHETAHTGIEASLTGHLVLSTLHTNSSYETISRLLDMGLDPFSFADSLLGILAQRLARRLCSACKGSYHPTLEEYEHLVDRYGRDLWEKKKMPSYNKDFQLSRAPGCPACRNTGYRGRLGLHELLIGDTEAIRNAIENKVHVSEIRRLSIQGGMTTLLQDGIEKVLKGSTDIKQVLSVCGSPD